MIQKYIFLLFLISAGTPLAAQNRYELNSGWICASLKEVKQEGQMISQPSFPTHNWMPAIVPGTILTSLLHQQKIPDPFYGMNNEKIPDVFETGNDYYTYWFVKDFTEAGKPGELVWLQLRGVNYKCRVYLNGKELTTNPHEGMQLRQQYHITNHLRKNGKNRLAIIVYPPDPPGNPNGGQGGDGTIARNLTAQYTAGWDWIQPMRDRNTGIWDKVTIEKTKSINLQNPHVVTIVPGTRLPDSKIQSPAIIKVSAEIINPQPQPVSGTLQYLLAGKTIHKKIILPANSTSLIQLADHSLPNPKLWWPNGYGPQHLYSLRLQFIQGVHEVLDEEQLSMGVRQIETLWNTHTQSRETKVNGQRIFIKGGNWIISDAMLRFSEERYDAELRFHRDMNLNLIRIWGGAIIERPEFYQACDKYGLLVFQDFGFSGDCNGRWRDPKKKDDQWTRRTYPDNHKLFMQTAVDQIKLIRNHPSLAFWCGGNEITPPDDILFPLRDSILPVLDGTRYFFDYSNSDSMSLNTLGGNGDGPYSIQDIKTFFSKRSYPFNSEIGSVGVGDYESLQKFIPPEHLLPMGTRGNKIDSVWNYHKYLPYGHYMDAYGAVKDLKDFAMKAQLLNYDQYRALIEGFSAHMWDWYTGTIIWKTQNPWTALRGQMYDCYLDVNACLFGLRKGSQPLHIAFNPSDSTILLINNGFTKHHNLMIEVKTYDIISGRENFVASFFNEIGPSMSLKTSAIAGHLKSLKDQGGVFLLLKLLKQDKSLASENFYWLPGADGNFTALQKMPKASLRLSARRAGNNRVIISLFNDKTNPVAFFNRIALLNKETGGRLLPVFFSDNYVSILPGETKVVEASYPQQFTSSKMSVQLYGWNVEEKILDVH